MGMGMGWVWGLKSNPHGSPGSSPMPDLKHSHDRPPNTWLKQITVDIDTTAADALQLAPVVLRGQHKSMLMILEELTRSQNQQVTIHACISDAMRRYLPS